MGVFTQLIDNISANRSYQLALCFALYIAYHVLKLHALLQAHPLADSSEHNNPWSSAWLRFAHLENYATSCALGAIAYYTERQQSRARAIVWVIACVILGAPCCCLYVALRLYDHGTLALVGEGGGLLVVDAERRPSK